MTDETPNIDDKEFTDMAERTLTDLFCRAQAANELHFALALFPEFRGMQGAGWNTAQDAVWAWEDFSSLIQNMSPNTRIYVRVALAFYLHVAECSGFYEVPKKLLLTIEGKGNNISPFSHLVEKHRSTGEKIAPNANRVLKDLIGHAHELGLAEFAEVLRDAFDHDLRNAIAHADYVIWNEGLRIRRRNGGNIREINWDEMTKIIDRGVNFFSLIRCACDSYTRSYLTPKTISGRMSESDPIRDWTIFCTADGKFGITSRRIEAIEGANGQAAPRKKCNANQENCECTANR